MNFWETPMTIEPWNATSCAPYSIGTTAIGTTYAPGLSGGTITLSGSGGSPGAGFSVITNANITAPVGTWGVAATGNYDGSGNFSIGLPVSPANKQLFYRIRTP